MAISCIKELKKTAKVVSFTTLCALSAIGMTACNQYKKSWTNTEPAQVSEEIFNQHIPQSEFDTFNPKPYAQHYSRHGDGGMDIAILYDANSKTYTSINASYDAAQMASSLRKAGVDTVRSSVVARENIEPKAVISYYGYDISAPPNCTKMPGYEGALEMDKEYDIGCTVDTLITKQVSHPKDLLGQTYPETREDGRRIVNSNETYHDGTPNAPLQGISTTSGI